MKKLVFWAYLSTLVTLSLLPVAFLTAPVFNIWDKAQHAFGFAVLTVTAIQAYPLSNRGRLGAVLFLLGCAIEIVQWAGGWRWGDWRDALANAVGIAVVLVHFRCRGPCVQKTR